MQATPPAWAGPGVWYERERPARYHRGRRPPPDLLPWSNLYTPKQFRRLIRLESALGRPGQALDVRALQAWLHERPAVPPLWTLPQLTHIELKPLQPLPLPPLPPAAPSRGGRAPWWRSATAGWAWLGVVLACLALLVAKERYRQMKKLRRRRSQEWPTPNVMATNHRQTSDIDISVSQLDTNTFPVESMDNLGTDLPPPYSECANAEANTTNVGANKFIVTYEEPPPPYSSCYVAFSNPKDGIPSVHFFNNQRQNLFESRTFANASNVDTERMTNVNSNDGNVIENAVGCDDNNEMIFENGTIVDRVTEDLRISSNVDTQLATVHRNNENNISNVTIHCSRTVAI